MAVWLKKDNQSMLGMYRRMKEDLPLLQKSFDLWIPEMMKWHFSEETGSPFWLEKKKALPFDPIADIRSREDLKEFGLFDKEEMRSIPVEQLLPRGFLERQRAIYETGGTTGYPIKVVRITTGIYNLQMYNSMLASRGLIPGHILGMTPSGPHAYGDFVRRLSNHWALNAFFIDFDPRWIKLCSNTPDVREQYLEHVYKQTVSILEKQKVQYLFTTPKLLSGLMIQLQKPLREYGIKAVCTGGTSCSPEEIRYLDENFLEDVHWIDTYGNTLLGHALQADDESALTKRAYYLPPPLGFINVVRSDDWKTPVEYGDRGRVLITALLEDLFIPNLIERDSAVRMPPHPWFPWDGVSHVGPFDNGDGQVINEGVY